MPPPSLRFVLLPISTRRALIYCDHRIPKPAPGAVAPKQSWGDWVVNKANTTWAGWEKSNVTWQLKLVQYGNMMFRRIPFEEWGLKSIPPMSKTSQDQAGGVTLEKVEVRYPAKYMGLVKPGVSEMLQKIATERQALHNRRMRYSLIIMPFTAPVAILPVIPNIPFFYAAFRAWSHWRALRGSQHLEQLIKSDSLQLAPNNILDNLYTAGLLYGQREEAQKHPEPSDAESEKVVQDLKQQTKQGEEDVMLLRAWNGKLIAEKLEMPSLETEIDRAVEQVEKAMKEEREKAAAPQEKKEVEQKIKQIEENNVHKR